MKRESRFAFWIIGTVLLFAFLYLIRSVLLPFAVGMTVAYFLDPAADRLERIGLSRLWATILITGLFFLFLIFLLILLIPTIETQITSFVQKIPASINTLHGRINVFIAQTREFLPSHYVERIQSTVNEHTGAVFGWIGRFAGNVLSGGLAVVGSLSLLFITPVVTFYLLCDWDKMIDRIDSWLPRHNADVIRQQTALINETLAGFLRGQALVCLFLGALYGAGLTFAGLDLGLLVGLGAGAISFIPYIGSISGFLVGIGLAVAQSSDWSLPAMIAAIFALGQIIEGYILTPRLVGNRVGLHPVWIIFALLAGGALFGFLGLLLAVPTAAVIGVLSRFALQNYMNSALYCTRATDETAHSPPQKETIRPTLSSEDN